MCAADDRKRRIQEILDSVWQCAPVERPEALARACDGDAELMAEVEALMASHEEPETVFEGAMETRLGVTLETSIGDGLSSEDDAEADRGVDGRVFGPYRLIRELGRGGQAVVFLAEDTRLKRRVALKVISGAGWLLSEEARQRFVREGAAAARLDHPGICAIYEVGEQAGMPYIVMRYVEGETLAEKLAKLRAEGQAAQGASASQPATRHDLHAAMELIEKIARALEVAHEAGILHRDVKPANVMVTEGGEPVILDFGLARDESGEEETLTRTGGVLGTPAYMAPEQVRGETREVGRHTDVFALGAMLYEVVTLDRPFMASTIDAIYRAIREEDPPDPRRLNPNISEDLRVVILTALEKDPKRRYATAGALAEDLLAVREDRPITARAAGPLDQAAKFVRRNRGLVVSAAIVFVVLVLGIIATTLGMLRAKEAEGVSDRRRREAEEALADSEAAVAFFGQLVKRGSKLAHGGRELTFREALDEVAPHLEEEIGDRPRVLATLNRIIGEDYVLLGDIEQGMRHLREAVRLRRELFGPHHAKTLEALYILGFSAVRVQALDEAEEVLAAAVAGLEVNAAVDPGLSSRIHSQFGQCAMLKGRLAEAEKSIRRGLEIYQATEQDDVILADLKSSLAAILRRFERYEEGEKLLREALVAMRREFGEGSNQVATLLNNLATNLKNQGRLEDSLPIYEESLATMRRLFGETHGQILIVESNYARTLSALNRHEAALKALEASVARHRSVLGEDDRRIAFPLSGLADQLEQVGRFKESEAAWREVLARFEKAHGPDDTRVADSQVALALVLLQTGRAKEAAPLIAAGLKTQAATFGKDSGRAYRARLAKIAIARLEGGIDEAESLAAELEDISRRHPFQRGSFLFEKALLARDAGRRVEAIRIFEEALELLGAPQTGIEELLARLSHELVLCLLAEKRDADARRLFDKVADVLIARLGAAHYLSRELETLRPRFPN